MTRREKDRKHVSYVDAPQECAIPSVPPSPRCSICIRKHFRVAFIFQVEELDSSSVTQPDRGGKAESHCVVKQRNLHGSLLLHLFASVLSVRGNFQWLNASRPITDVGKAWRSWAVDSRVSSLEDFIPFSLCPYLFIVYQLILMCFLE